MNQPKLFSKHNLFSIQDTKLLLSKYSDKLKWKTENEMIMDIGCGDGKVTAEVLRPFLPKSIKTLIGCDISEVMVKYAKEVFSSPTVDFITFDITSPVIPEEFKNGFDHIFSMFCLHWVKDRRTTMNNIYDMLKPGGQMLMAFFEYGPVFEVLETMSKYEKWAFLDHEFYIPPSYKTKKSRDYWEQHVYETGFIDIDFRIEKKSYLSPDMEYLQDLYISVNPIVAKVPLEGTSEYINDYTTEVRRSNSVSIETSKDGIEEIRMHYNLITIFASKPPKQ